MTPLLVWLFDATLAAALLWFGWRIVSTSNLFEAVVLFVSFGLLMSLSWMRLAAPDVALAEAAIGAGLSGALLMNALSRLDGGRPDEESADR